MTEGLYVEDLTIGQRYCAGPLDVSLEDIKRFAKEYDPQYFHVDEELAKASLFGGIVASGWHTAALTMKLLIADGSPFARGAIGSRCDLSWPKAVHPGDALSVESEVLEILPAQPHRTHGRVKFLITTVNQHGDAVQKLTATLLVMSRATQA